jgi:hypothetical protein
MGWNLQRFEAGEGDLLASLSVSFLTSPTSLRSITSLFSGVCFSRRGNPPPFGSRVFSKAASTWRGAHSGNVVLLITETAAAASSRLIVCDTLPMTSERGQKMRRSGHDAAAQASIPQPTVRPVERLFPFVLRSRTLLVGRDTLRRGKSRLHFVLITRDISAASRAEILSDFVHYPVVQEYTTRELEEFFGVKGAKVIGFEKSELAQSIYLGLKEHRINQALNPADPKKHR